MVNGKYPSMFEPVHGSALDIYGKGIANPIGQIWTAKMMLDHFGEEELGALLLKTIEDVTADGVKTPDLGGTATTKEVAEEVTPIIITNGDALENLEKKAEGAAAKGGTVLFQVKMK